MRLLIMGPPGAGKGTQSTGIAARYDIPIIATGEMFRRHIAQGTEIGRQVKSIIDAGHYVPDELTEAIVYGRLSREDCANGFLLDGFPRTMHQVTSLDSHLAVNHQRLDAVLSLVADPDEVVRRLAKRALIEGRSDDTEDTIRHRQELYLRETAPLMQEYRKRGLLVEVDALGEIGEVSARIYDALDRAIAD